VNEPPNSSDVDVVVDPPGSAFGPEVDEKLRSELAVCPDIAFAHLARVTVGGPTAGSQLSLFVWLVPEAVGSLRAALNLVCEAVARALPEDRFLDVLILNSAPELLASVLAAGDPIVVRDDDERRRAVDAAAESSSGEPPKRGRFGWW
jgi:hypothetical protein